VEYVYVLTPVTETMPGMAISRDVTEVFASQGYWASFNVPWFGEIFDAAGYPQKAAEAGSWYSYNESARSRIFARDAPNVSNVEGMMRLMRSNDYANDPLANGDPGQQILGRYDLRSDGGSRAPFGGVNTKTATALNVLGFLRFSVIGAPEYETQTAWEFGKPPFENLAYDGLPQAWQFNWTEFAAAGYDLCGGYSGIGACVAAPGCGWCGGETKCKLGFDGGPALGIECKSGWAMKKKDTRWAIPTIVTLSVLSAIFMIFLLVYNVMGRRKRLVLPRSTSEELSRDSDQRLSF
jgi:hypothetical protein